MEERSAETPVSLGDEYLGRINVSRVGIDIDQRAVWLPHINVLDLFRNDSRKYNLIGNLNQSYAILAFVESGVSSDIHTILNFNLYHSSPATVFAAVSAIRRVSVAYGFGFMLKNNFNVEAAVYRANLMARQIYDEIGLGGSLLNFCQIDGEDGIPKSSIRGKGYSIISGVYRRLVGRKRGRSISDIVMFKYRGMEALNRLEYLYRRNYLEYIFMQLMILRKEIRLFTNEKSPYLSISGTGLSYDDQPESLLPHSDGVWNVKRKLSLKEEELMAFLCGYFKEVYSQLYDFIQLLVSMRGDNSVLRFSDINTMMQFVSIHLAWLQAQTQTETASTN